MEIRAFRIEQTPDGPRGRLVRMPASELTPGEVQVRVLWSAVNYKDALAGTGRAPILRRYPLNGGIDAAGIVTASADPRFRPGDRVVVTGCGLSETLDGGYGERLNAPAGCVVHLPEGLTLREAAAIGTAGFTVALALQRLEAVGLTPAHGPFVVTGATGGVGMLAVDILSRAGFELVAVTGKMEHAALLRTLGAAEVLDRRTIDPGSRPLERARWGGALDSVGGELLAWLTRTVRPWGAIAAVGLAGGSELRTTVMPFILRGVSLLGVSSANCPEAWRAHVWERLAGPLHPRHLDRIVTGTVPLDGLPEVFEALLAGGHVGRTLVRVAPGDED